MVTNVTSLTGNGLKDWLIQRATAVFLATYAIFFFGFFIAHPSLEFSQLQGLFHSTWFQVASVIAILSIVLHAWIGIWTVTTDYINCTIIRLTVQLLVVLYLLGQFIWALMIIWGQ